MQREITEGWPQDNEPMHWRTFEWAECSACGCEAEILTDVPRGYARTDDEARCIHCGLTGIVNVEEDGEPWINWRDEE